MQTVHNSSSPAKPPRLWTKRCKCKTANRGVGQHANPGTVSDASARRVKFARESMLHLLHLNWIASEPTETVLLEVHTAGSVQRQARRSASLFGVKTHSTALHSHFPPAESTWSMRSSVGLSLPLGCNTREAGRVAKRGARFKFDQLRISAYASQRILSIQAEGPLGD